MGLAVLVVVGGVVIGLLCGGSWAKLTALRLRSRALVVGAVVAQAGGATLGVLGVADPRRSYVVGLIASAALAFAFCARNISAAGVPLVTAGLIANAVVVAANGAMPVSIVAAYDARVPITAISAGDDARHTIAGTGTSLRWLGDVVPVPLPLRPEVASPGDVLIAAGLGELVVLAMVGGWVPTRRRASDGEEVT